MAERPLTLMAVHAHPDDEATGTGGVLARAAAEGIATILVTCTDGGCGDGPGGIKPGEPGHDPKAVVAMRQTELEASCAALGVTELETLGYADSGMMGWSTNDAPGAFWRTPVDEAAARLADLIRRYEPDVLVTYDENGFYGHPDHIQAHRVAMAAVEATTSVQKVYWTTVPRSRMAEFGRIMREHGADWDTPDSATHNIDSGNAEPDSGPQILDSGPQIPDVGLPDEEITTWVDIRPYVKQKFDALLAHASQSENIFFLRLGMDLFAETMGVETFVRVRDTSGAPTPEDDLFAGLR